MNHTIVFDTETTGLLKPSATYMAEQPSIIEIHCTKIDDDFKMVGEYGCLIKPPQPISEKITEITGLTNEILSDKPSFFDICEELAEFFLGVRRIVAHNLAFDREMLYNELARIEKQWAFPWPFEHYCTVEHSMVIEQRRLTLAKLHLLATGSDLPNAHRAKDDVYGTIRCYHWLISKGM